MKKWIFRVYNILKCNFLGIKGNFIFKSSVFVGKNSRIINCRQIKFSRNDIVGKYGYIACYGKGRIIMGEAVNIGMYSMIASINSIKIGNDVLLGPNVYLADYNHTYEDVSIPVSKQPLKPFSKGISIGDGSWIGKNVVIIGGCSIGKHCVIGANSFVNKDLPDYSVCAGNPCHIIKRYDFKKKEWIN